MQKYQVQTWDYDRELHRDVIMNTEKFWTKEEAMEYAKTIKQTSDSVTIVTDDYGYTRIAKITRSEIKEYKPFK